ncbi:FkbM family methyltransferase [Labrys monachus]|uniref:FkbM family methyltransferase n=1 Tax=Labrys monachus TaxID=217067 RepID=A0ABU0FL16_9HYPH|nr:FkbM family methyltransferase [Labrys monachus]MDQ0394788.1 FkbM family methyltransferase [Labrys monachus]
MKRLGRNLTAAVRKPSLGIEYVGWSLQRALRRGGPVRRIGQIELGSFNGFSEYHSVVQGVSDAENRFIQTYAFGQGAIVDVGANLGIFSLLMSKRFPERVIHAFEPGPTTFQALEANIARNRAANIRAYRMAVADRNGSVSFVARESARANSSIQLDGEAVTPSAVTVSCTTLDTFASTAGLERIALLKVDVEGYEDAVFRGAAHLFSASRPRIIYFEVCPQLATGAGAGAGDAAHFLTERGYALNRVADNGSLVPVDPADARDVVLDNWVGVDIR